MLRVVVLSYESHQSCSIVSGLIGRQAFEPVGFVRSTVVDPRRRGLRLVRFLLAPNRRWGVFWKVVEVVLSRVAGMVHRATGHRGMSLKSVAHSAGVPSIDCSDPTDPTFLATIEALKPDLLLSVHFNHVLKPVTWNVASLGAINVHGGLLPNHRGLFPHFYALAAGDHEGGVTVHWVDDRLDTGQPISRKTIPILANDTVVRLENRAIPASIDAIAEAMKLIEGHGRESVIEPIPNSPTSYHSWPTNDDMRNLRREKHRYLDLADVRDLLRAAPPAADDDLLDDPPNDLADDRSRNSSEGSRPASARPRWLSWLMATAVTLLTLGLLPGTFAPTFFPNEDVYLPRLIRAARPGPLRTDWTLSGLAPDRNLFEFLFGPLARHADPTLIAQIGRPLGWMALFAALFAVLKSLGFRSPVFTAGLTAVWLLPNPYTVSQEWLLGSFESKTFAWAAMFAMFASVGRRRLLLGAMWTAICVGLHFTLGFWCCLLFVAAVAASRSTLRQSVQALAVAVVGGGLFGLPMIRFMLGSDSQQTTQDLQLFTRRLWGFHSDPFQFPKYTVALVLVVAGSAVLARYVPPQSNQVAWRVLGAVELASLVAFGVGCVARLLNLDQVLLALPFRVAPVIVPLGGLLRLASWWRDRSVAVSSDRLVPKVGQRRSSVLVLAGVLALIVGQFGPSVALASQRVETFSNGWRPARSAESIAGVWVAANVPTDALVAADPGQALFAEVNRPMVGSFLAAPNNELVEWKSRMLALSGVDVGDERIERAGEIRSALTDGFNTRAPEVVLGWRQTYGVTHLMTRGTYSFPLLKQIGPVHIYELPQGASQ